MSTKNIYTLRVRELQSELNQARQQIHSLMTENRILKMVDQRLENALSKYEGTHAQLPLVIKSYGEDLRTLQTRLRRMKHAYRELENRYRTQGAELLSVQKQHKHLLDLTKNKQLAEREKLTNQLQQAEDKIKLQETKNQNLIKKIELQSKSYQSQINTEISKSKQLKKDLNNFKRMNDQLKSKVEKLNYQSYSGRRSYAWGIDQNHPTDSIRSREIRPTTRTNSLQMDDTHCAGGGLSTESDEKPSKPMLVHGESDFSDHTKDLQMNQIRQVHQDTIHKPNMLLMGDRSDSPTSNKNSLWLNNEISELMTGKDLSYVCDNDNIVASQNDCNVADNPYSLLMNLELATPNKYVISDSSSVKKENTSIKIEKPPLTRKSLRELEESLSDDDVSSISTVTSGSDYD